MAKQFTLGELEPGSEVVISCRTTHDTYEQPARLHTISGNTVFFEPVFVNGKLLNFLSEETHCDIYWKNNGRTVIFRGVNIPIGYSASLQRRTQCCSTEVKGDEINHRMFKRHDVNKYCIITKGNHKGTTEAYLKDVSLGGFAITVRSYEVEPGDEIHVALEPQEGRKLYLSGSVVRKMTSDDEETIIVGCSTYENQKEFVEFVMQAERDKIKRLRRRVGDK